MSLPRVVFSLLPAVLINHFVMLFSKNNPLGAQCVVLRAIVVDFLVVEVVGLFNPFFAVYLWYCLTML